MFQNNNAVISRVFSSFTVEKKTSNEYKYMFLLFIINIYENICGNSFIRIYTGNVTWKIYVCMNEYIINVSLYKAGLFSVTMYFDVCYFTGPIE